MNDGEKRTSKTNHVIDFQEKRKRKRREDPIWLQFIQVVTLATCLMFLYKGVNLLVHVNESYVNHTLIPAQKLSSVANPEAKEFATTFVRNWLGPSIDAKRLQADLSPLLETGKLATSYFEAITSISVTQIVSKSQFQGVMELHVTGITSHGVHILLVKLPLEYNPTQKKYQIYAYPVLQKL